MGLPNLVRLWVAQVPSPLWVGIRNSAMTPNIEPRLEETSFTLPNRTQKPQKTTAPDPKKLAQGSPQPCPTMRSPAHKPPYTAKAFRNKYHPTVTDPKPPHRKLPHATTRNSHTGLPSLVGIWIAQVPSPLWVGIRNSAMTPQYRAKAGRDKFHHTAPDPKSPENYRTGPKKFAQGSHQSGKNTDSPGTVPLMGRQP